MPREKRQHMIEKRNPRPHRSFAPSIDIQLRHHFRFGGLPIDPGLSSLRRLFCPLQNRPQN
jgi:hypothetical protein